MISTPLSGPGVSDATAYLTRRRLYAGNSSSLRKIMRAQRIAAGLRPLRMPRTKTERHHVGAWSNDKITTRLFVVETAKLHPTKGFRDFKRKLVSEDSARRFG